MRYWVTCRYDGTPFQGWQKQPKDKTVQGDIERVFSIILNEPITIHSASRTDAKVHALGQSFHFDTKNPLPAKRLKLGANRLLDRHIEILSIKKVDERFHARFSPSIKTYQYHLRLKPHPFHIDRSMMYHHPLDVRLIRRAMKLFLGTHDFRNFTIKKEDRYDFKRTMTSFRMKPSKEDVIFTLVGNGFMTHMVRMIIGTLLALNEGKITLEDIAAQLKPKKQLPISYKAEAQGLWLMRIHYEKRP